MEVSASTALAHRQSVSEIAEVALTLIDHGPADANRIPDDGHRARQMAESLRQHGQLTPILIAPHNDRYITLAGATRRDAARLLSWPTIGAIIRHDCGDHHTSIAAIENLHRNDLSPIEEAEAVRQCLLACDEDIDRAACTLSRTRDWLDSRLALLNFPPDIQMAIHERRISMAAATPLASIRDQAMREHMLAEAIRFGCSARVTREWARQLRMQRPPEESVTAVEITAMPDEPLVRCVATCFVCDAEADLTHLTQVPVHSSCLQALQHQLAQSRSPERPSASESPHPS